MTPLSVRLLLHLRCCAPFLVAGCGAERPIQPAPPPGTHAGYYVTPSGSAGGSGSATSPWDLATGLAGGGGKVQPGDTVWLRGGTYRGQFTDNLNGSSGNFIVVRQYPGERATIDGSLKVLGSYAIMQGFEVMSSATTTTGPAGIYHQ